MLRRNRGPRLLCVLAVVLSGCMQYGVYTINSLPKGAHVIGPHDSDWGTEGTPHTFAERGRICQVHKVTLALEGYEDKAVDFEACTDYDDRIEAARHADDENHNKVYRLKRVGGEAPIGTAPQAGEVAISSSPSGADVSIGVEPVCSTPCRYAWKQGDQVIEFTFQKAGFKTVTLTVGPTNARVHATLQPINARER